MPTIKRLEGATDVSWRVTSRNATHGRGERRFPTKREAETFAAALPKVADTKGSR